MPAWHHAILSYAAKFASASTDRSERLTRRRQFVIGVLTRWMSNLREAMHEIELDIAKGANMI